MPERALFLGFRRTSRLQRRNFAIKAYGAIRRFSEDVDLTYDIRTIAPDLVNTSDDNPVPQTRSQSKKWSAQARERLPVWVKEKALPVIEAAAGGRQTQAGRAGNRGATLSEMFRSRLDQEAACLRIPMKSHGCTDMKSPGDSETMSPTFPI